MYVIVKMFFLSEFDKKQYFQFVAIGNFEIKSIIIQMDLTTAAGTFVVIRLRIGELRLSDGSLFKNVAELRLSDERLFRNIE